MKKVNVEDAVGMTLCHDITAMYDGFKGAAFRRGHVIEEQDIPKLLDYGKRSIFVWEENAGEVHEEDCALRMSAAAPMEHGHYSAPSEGKVNLVPDCDGMFRVDASLLRQLNSIPDITVSAIPDHFPATKGKRVASMRIVPLVTKEENIRRFELLCEGKQLFRLYPYREMKVGIIITGSEIYTGRTKDKFEEIARRKLSRFPSTVLGCIKCDDDIQMITSNARYFMDHGADMIFFSGGMSVDPDDVTPASIRALGAEVITYGVPAQPGNMTLISYLDDVALLGIPGASVSCTTTMFDVILPQLFTGEKFTREEVTALGEGGLCMQCKECHFPNCTFGRY